MPVDPGLPNEDSAGAEGSPIEERGWLSMMRALEGAHAADLAEAYARGERCLSVVYGAVESPQDQEAVDELHAALEGLPEVLGGQASQSLRTTGRQDRATWWWASSDQLPADVIAGFAEQLAHERGQAWWHITQDPA